jgi:hypothetical protein
MSNGHNEDEHSGDRLVEDYGTVLRESAVLTTFAGILFGFLFNVSIDIPERFSLTDRAALLVAFFSITVAISLFVMPVIYHHVQYPYRDIEKFKNRSHRFIMFGLIPAGITLYLGLAIALSAVMQAPFAFAVGAAPFVLVYIFFRLRK